MLKIRLKRFGKKFYPIYRIVVMDARKCRDSAVIAQIGNYESHSKKLSFNSEIYEKYIDLGAQPTEVVKNLFKLSKKSN